MRSSSARTRQLLMHFQPVRTRNVLPAEGGTAVLLHNPCLQPCGMRAIKKTNRRARQEPAKLELGGGEPKVIKSRQRAHVVNVCSIDGRVVLARFEASFQVRFYGFQPFFFCFHLELVQNLLLTQFLLPQLVLRFFPPHTINSDPL